jgi:hypothetical protein
MVTERLLLCEDFDAEMSRLIAAGEAAGLRNPPGVGSPRASCQPRPPDNQHGE